MCFDDGPQPTGKRLYDSRQCISFLIKNNSKPYIFIKKLLYIVDHER